MKKLAFIELHQETNSFSSMPTSMREFESLVLAFGQEIPAIMGEYKTQSYGFYKGVEKWGKGEFEVAPIMAAWSWSGGPIQREVYEELRDRALEMVKKIPDLAGIYLSLHGAMGVAGLRDPESDFLRHLRAMFGSDFPIAVSFDLHAVVTRENIDLATFLVGYHTNPHRDHSRMAQKVSRILMETIRGNVRPVMAFRKLRLLKGGGWGIDFLNPMRGIVQQMKRLERRKGVLAVTTFWVHLWIDDPEVGWASVVVTDANEQLAEELAEELAESMWAVRHKKHPVPKQVDEAIAISKKSKLRRMVGTTVWCDLSDIVGAGAPGGNTNILAQLRDEAPDLTSYVPVRDPEAVLAAYPEARLGQRLRLTLGGRIDPNFNPPVEFTGEVMYRGESKWGKTLVLREGGVHVVATEIAFPAYWPGDFRSLDLNLWKADVTVVKNLFPFRFKYLRYNRRTLNVISKGTTNIDVHALPYKEIPRPIFPLDDIDDWRE